MNALIDFWLKRFKRLSLFGTARLTRHQFMRNFAFASFFALFGVSIMSILTTWGLGMGFYFHGLHDHDQEMALLMPYIVVEGLIFTVFALTAQAFAAVQRFHDMNKSGWYALTLLIPLYNCYALYLPVHERRVTHGKQVWFGAAS
jgi:uncharacterized membrane protein YhaH (DUF805 family)